MSRCASCCCCCSPPSRMMSRLFITALVCLVALPWAGLCQAQPAEAAVLAVAHDRRHGHAVGESEKASAALRAMDAKPPRRRDAVPKRMVASESITESAIAAGFERAQLAICAHDATESSEAEGRSCDSDAALSNNSMGSNSEMIPTSASSSHSSCNHDEEASSDHNAFTPDQSSAAAWVAGGLLCCVLISAAAGLSLSRWREHQTDLTTTAPLLGPDEGGEEYRPRTPGDQRTRLTQHPPHRPSATSGRIADVVEDGQPWEDSSPDPSSPSLRSGRFSRSSQANGEHAGRNDGGDGGGGGRPQAGEPQGRWPSLSRRWREMLFGNRDVPVDADGEGGLNGDAGDGGESDRIWGPSPAGTPALPRSTRTAPSTGACSTPPGDERAGHSTLTVRIEDVPEDVVSGDPRKGVVSPSGNVMDSGPHARVALSLHHSQTSAEDVAAAHVQHRAVIGAAISAGAEDLRAGSGLVNALPSAVPSRGGDLNSRLPLVSSSERRPPIKRSSSRSAPYYEPCQPVFATVALCTNARDGERASGGASAAATQAESHASEAVALHQEPPEEALTALLSEAAVNDAYALLHDLPMLSGFNSPSVMDTSVAAPATFDGGNGSHTEPNAGPSRSTAAAAESGVLWAATEALPHQQEGELTTVSDGPTTSAATGFLTSGCAGTGGGLLGGSAVPVVSADFTGADAYLYENEPDALVDDLGFDYELDSGVPQHTGTTPIVVFTGSGRPSSGGNGSGMLADEPLKPPLAQSRSIEAQERLVLPQYLLFDGHVVRTPLACTYTDGGLRIDTTETATAAAQECQDHRQHSEAITFDGGSLAVGGVTGNHRKGDDAKAALPCLSTSVGGQPMPLSQQEHEELLRNRKWLFPLVEGLDDL